MSLVYLDGCLMNKKEQRNFLLMAFIAGISLVGFALFLWHIALISQQKDQRVATIAALLFTCMSLFILHSGYKTYRFASSKYICDHHCIYIYYGSNRYVVDLAESFYLSTIYVRVNRGRANAKLGFYLFSTTPINNIESGNIDIKGITDLLNTNAVILPCDESVTMWIKENICIFPIPSFPKIAYKPGND